MSIISTGSRSFESSIPILVVGGGGTGLCAALAAREAGAEVLVLERDKVPLGSTAMSTGLIPAANTRFQRDAGVKDSPEQFSKDILIQSRGQTDREIVRILANQSAATIEWLVDDHHVPLFFLPDLMYPGHQCPRMHATPHRSGGELMGALFNACQRVGVDVLTQATVTDLFVQEGDRILGVLISRPDGSSEEIGCNVLVLASSGFSGNPELITEHIPEMSDVTVFGHAGNKGDALRWGMKLGAAIADIHAYQGHGGLACGYSIPIGWPLIFKGGFQVNAEGVRFSDESKGPHLQGPKIIAQSGGFAWNIFDEQRHNYMLAYEDYKNANRAGCLAHADTIAALAEKTDLPARSLRDTLHDVRSMAQGGMEDPFGRDFTSSLPLDPPYYAVKVTAALFHTQGGLVVDFDGRVKREDGRVFPNLFAGGGAARGVSGPSYWGYLPGNGLLTATTFGRIAGRAAARFT